MNITGLLDPLGELSMSGPEFGDASDREIYDLVHELIRSRNLVEHLLAEGVSELDRRGIARKVGGRTSVLLARMGLAPAVAHRMLRLAALARHQRTDNHFAAGAISSEHADAIVVGLAHIGARVSEPLGEEQRDECEVELLAQVFSGAAPRTVAHHARALGNGLAEDDPAAVPAAEDRSLNMLDHNQTPDGRLEIRADLDVTVGEKFVTLIDAWSQPRPEPDGSADKRSATRRRADALETILDRAASGVEATDAQPLLGGAPKTEIMLTIPANAPDLAALQWLGPISRATVRQVSCDPQVTEVVLDGHGVPLDVGRSKRICPPGLRKAVILRDGGGCIKCGAPAAWAHIHHMRHWSEGGPTSLDNLCVLCPACHSDVHALGWEIVLGHDRHPWLIPPTSVDRHRRPLPGYHRKRVHITDLPVAC